MRSGGVPGVRTSVRRPDIAGAGAGRDGAVRKMISTLGELEIEGVATNRDFLYDVVNHPDFKSGRFHTGFIEENYPM